MGKCMRQGAVAGLLTGLIMILTQPFHPPAGLIPELVTFLTTVPIWLAAMVFPGYLPPLAEAAMILMYLIAMGALIGAAFDLKPIWGWFLVIALAIHHYMIYESIGRGMSEIIQGIMGYFAG